MERCYTLKHSDILVAENSQDIDKFWLDMSQTATSIFLFVPNTPRTFVHTLLALYIQIAC